MSQPTTADPLERIAMALQRGIASGIHGDAAGIDPATPGADRSVATISVELPTGESLVLNAYGDLTDLTDAQLEVAAELRRQRLEDAPPEVIHRRVDRLEVLNRRLQRARP